MNKKIIATLMLCMVLCPSAYARGHGGPHFYGHHHHHHYGRGIGLAAGIIGTTAGILLAEQLINSRPRRVEVQPKVYLVEPEGNCYTVVSRKTGKVTQKCVENASDDIIYVD